MKLFTGIKWIFFDLGSTLVDETRVYEKRIAHLTEQGHVDREEFIKAVCRCAETSATPIGTAAELFGIGELLPPWDNSLERLYPNVPEVLQYLLQKYKLGVIANQTPGTEDRLRQWEIAQYFTVIAASAEEGCAKPDPKLFQIALERAECQPHEAIMIGDRLDNDMEPAKRLGMRTIRIRQSLSSYQKDGSGNRKPDVTIDNLKELKRLL